MSLWQQLSTKTNSRENWLLVHRSLKWTGATDNLPRTPIFSHRKGSLLCYFLRYVLINHKIVPCSPFWRQTSFPSEWRSLFSQRAQTRVCRISSLVSIRNISRGTVTQFWIFRGETWNVSIGKEKLQGEKAFTYIFATQSNGLSTCLFTLARKWPTTLLGLPRINWLGESRLFMDRILVHHRSCCDSYNLNTWVRGDTVRRNAQVILEF